MIALSQLRNLTERTLKALNMYSEDALNLVLGTIYQESLGGTYIRQLSGGSALGICQMEPATFKDIIENYLNYNKDLKIRVIVETNVHRLEAEALEYNLALSIAFCRLHYERYLFNDIPETVEEYAHAWKKYYNTHKGKGTEEQFINNYKKYISNEPK